MRCYDLKASVPPNSQVEILAPNVMVSGGGAFGRYLSPECRALKNEMSALYKDSMVAPGPPDSAPQQESTIHEPGSRSLQATPLNLPEPYLGLLSLHDFEK